MKFYLVLFSIILSLSFCPVKADNTSAPAKAQAVTSGEYIEAQEKLMYAQGSYKTAKQQENAMENMRKAAKLSLRAAKLRAKAEKTQSKADSLIHKAGQQAVTRGLYITNPLLPVMMQAPPIAEKTAERPSFVPVPGQSINIIAPRAEQVSYEKEQPQQEEYLPEPPTLNNF